jgi:hypothetical protein
VTRSVCIVLVALLGASHVLAGMPSPLPENPGRVLRLGDSPLMRLQTISFFLLVFLLSAAAVRFLWNWVARDYPRLPRLTYGRAVGVVFLWGLLFVLVLTMISGARELMTPGAWQKQGFTYRLAADPPPAAEPDPETTRRQHMEKLRTALWQFAATHQGKFPVGDEVTAIPTALWEVPGGGGLRYFYVPNLSAGHVPDVLVYEPELDPVRRLVLRTNGDIVLVTSVDLRPLHGTGRQP